MGTGADVVVVGGGPVGVLIANLLGVYGVQTLVLERSPEILDYPRAVGMDDEALRVLQAAGLAQDILRDAVSNVPMRMFTADRRCFADILPTTREFGWYRRNIFSQPLAEQALRHGLERFAHVGMWTGAELTGLAQDGDGASLQVQDSDGKARQLRARYVVAADGGRSTVRDKLLHIPFDGRTHARKWVVIECENDPLDAPYTALHCEPARPYVSLRLPYGLRRWEFLLFPGEDDEQMLRPERVRALLAAHVPDPAALRIIRARVYAHHSRVARRFREGRVFLAGDAAHLSPPWIGQGLNAGFRDAGNLAWKLAGVVHGTLAPAVLDTYHCERHGHARTMIELADQVGAIFSLRNRPLAWLRDRLLLAMQYLPPVRDYVLQMRFKPMPRYDAQGVVAPIAGRESALLGRMAIQPLVELPDGRTVRLDDACGPGLCLVGWNTDPWLLLDDAQRARWRRLGAASLMVVRSRSGAGPGRPVCSTTSTVVVQDVENLLSGWFLRGGGDVVLLRPDRYVAAVCRGTEIALLGEKFLDRFSVAQAPCDAPAGATENPA